MRTFLAVTTICIAGAAGADTTNFRVLGQPVGSGLIQQQKEQPFFETLAERAGIDATFDYLPVDVAGIPDNDGMRVVRTGLFDIVSFRGPQVSRDEPTMLGLDLVGLNPTYEKGRAHAAAFLPTVDAAVQERFNAQGSWCLARRPAGNFLQARNFRAGRSGRSESAGRGPICFGLRRAIRGNRCADAVRRSATVAVPWGG